MARPVAKKESPAVKSENSLMRSLRESAIGRFLRETIAELRKVVWPTRDEAFRLTGIVIGVVIVMALFFGGIDYVLNLVVQFLLR